VAARLLHELQRPTAPNASNGVVIFFEHSSAPKAFHQCLILNSQKSRNSHAAQGHVTPAKGSSLPIRRNLT
jgi:hypothetical protein